MQARRYEARLEDYGNLLARIKDEMGTNVMVQTRRFRKGGFLGLFGVQEWVEVLAAPKSSQPRDVVRDSVEISRAGIRKQSGEGGEQIVKPAMISVPKTPGISRPAPREIHIGDDQIGVDGGDGQDGIRQEIREIKKMVAELTRKVGNSSHSEPSVAFDAVRATSGARGLTSVEHETLSQVIGWDIHPQRALNLMKKAISENPHNLDTLTVEMLLKRIKKVVIGDILLASGMKVPPVGQGMVAAFIGATGVGKTTTIAKLAAQFGVRDDRKVALISLDTYRVGAQEQLRTYADIMKLPISIVFNGEEYKEACDKYRSDHIVLVDTAGRSPFNKEHMHELREAFRLSTPDSVQLVVDACTKADDIRIMLEKFSGIGFDHIVISKLDQTGSLGSIYTINNLTNRPISYFSVGQSVPDDIRVASVEFIQKWCNTGKI
ncbi:hypothetical protein J7K50_08165 [bacterium]|nr:hypothetical protein [bacterium]